jgi:N-sulfoglucosamine sulfohydrolase
MKFTSRLAALFVLLLLSFSVSSAQTNKPNILWILMEDVGPEMACYGEPLVQTPNIDRLAREGVRFTNAHTTAPVCSPSRSALITGMYQTTIRAHQHRTFERKPLPAGVDVVTNYLRKAGYFTVLSGKPPNQKDGKTSGAAGSGKSDFNFLIDKPFDGYDWNQRKAGQPFFAQLSLQESHRGGGWPLARKTLKNLIDPNQVKLPPTWPDHAVARNDYANYLDAIQLCDVYVGEILQRLEREKLLDNTIIIFAGDNGQCSHRGKQFLYDQGTHIPLIVRFPDRKMAGTVRDDLLVHIDITATTLKLAGITPPASMQGKDFLASDFKREMIFTARDRMDISTDRMRAVRTKQFKYIRNFYPMIPYMQHNDYKERQYPVWNLIKELNTAGKLNPELKLFAGATKPVEELYDLTQDPWEVKNLAALPEYKETLLKLRAEVDKWMEETNDQGWQMEDPLRIHAGYYGKK